MTAHLAAGASVSFAGNTIGQLLSFNITEGETNADGADFSDTSLDLTIQFDRGLDQHQLALNTSGTLSIVPASGLTAITIADAVLVGRQVRGSVGQVVVGALRFESIKKVVFP